MPATHHHRETKKKRSQGQQHFHLQGGKKSNQSRLLITWFGTQRTSEKRKRVVKDRSMYGQHILLPITLYFLLLASVIIAQRRQLNRARGRPIQRPEPVINFCTRTHAMWSTQCSESRDTFSSLPRQWSREKQEGERKTMRRNASWCILKRGRTGKLPTAAAAIWKHRNITRVLYLFLHGLTAIAIDMWQISCRAFLSIKIVVVARNLDCRLFPPRSVAFKWAKCRKKSTPSKIKFRIERSQDIKIPSSY